MQNIQAFPKNAIKLGVIREQFIIGKEPVKVVINVREMMESRHGFTFLTAGNYNLSSSWRVLYQRFLRV